MEDSIFKINEYKLLKYMYIYIYYQILITLGHFVALLTCFKQ
jgi:hypothetical protein